ncbi:MAG TPA: ABC transporter permease [Bacillota bacterium]|nr:ABC transporter permease [Bacillota bacterium]
MSALLAGARRLILTRFRYSDAWFFYLLWPVMFPAAYLFTAGALAGGGQGFPDYRAYIVSGTLLWMWVNLTCWSTGGALRQEQTGGTLETNWASPAPRWALLCGPAVADIGLGLVAMAIGAAESTLLFHVRWPASWAVTAAVLAASVPWVLGVGLCLAALVFWAKDVASMVNLVRGLFMVACGITCPVAVLPGWLQAVGSALPMTYALDAIRGGPWGADLARLLAFDLGLLALGAILFAAVERSVRRRGAVGVY